ncbi:MAG: glycerophosphodiester phosphodiesterase family protein [Bacteroidota bacterium]
MFLRLTVGITMLFLLSCGPQEEAPQTIDVQGHRGCRGLLPENTIPAFLKALDIGVHTLELDAVITQDKQVIVSHEPYMSHEISTTPEGELVSEEDEKFHNIYQMTAEQVQTYDVGLRPHLRFPNQEKMAVHKPLLSEVIAAAETAQAAAGRPAVRYNIETKSQPQRDSVFHPGPEEFVDLLVEVMEAGGILERSTLQSFDVRTLQVAHTKYPELDLVLLVENQMSLEENLELLGFVPEVYSPYLEFVDEQMVKTCAAKGMALIPWTVNEATDIDLMLKLGVDGIISDYPDRVMKAL